MEHHLFSAQCMGAALSQQGDREALGRLAAWAGATPGVMPLLLGKLRLSPQVRF